MSDSSGQFAWYDLMTGDAEAALAFYTEVIGWKTQAWEGPMSYTMFCVGERPIGGVMQRPEEVAAQGAPPHWMAYVAVADITAKTRQVTELGGKVHRDVTDIPEVGRFSVIADPQGAVLALFQPAEAMEEAAAAPGEFTWHELYTTDYESAWKFYSALFGWTHTESFDMGPEMGTYFMYERSGSARTRGGMSNAAKAQGFPPNWMYYVTVDDLDAAVERVQSNGGKILTGPMEVPGGDRIAQCMDPQGAAFALHWRKA